MRNIGSVFEVSRIAVIVILCVLAIRYFVFQPFIVEGASMEPSYNNGDYLLVEKVSYRLHTPKRGDTVVLRYPNNPSINYVKRIIGLPGETLRIANGEVRINGALLKEAYLAIGERTIVMANPEAPYEITLSQDQYFVMGDNRDHSSDSREGWLVKEKHIVGRTVVVLYPVQDLKFIPSPQY